MNHRNVPFLSLGGLFEADDIAATNDVVTKAAAGGSFFPAAEETRFQDAFAGAEAASHAVAVNSCGTALDLCMMAIGVGEGDEVIVPPLTFICTATCAAARGAKVVFADVDSSSLCLDPNAVRRKISEKTKAIIPVHFAGLSCDIDAFDAIARETGAAIVYDAAHAVGTLYKGQGIGGRGTASCYSFQSNKNMTTLGEGGAVTTNDEAFAELVRQKKTFGFIYGSTPRVVTVGFNYRLTKPQLACGLTQLSKLPRIIALRLERFRRMQELLNGIEELVLPAGIEEGHACHLYVVRVNTRIARFTRDELVQQLKSAHGVHTAVHYPAVYEWEVFGSLVHDRSDCSVGDLASRTVLSLPIFPQTNLDDLEYVAEALKASIYNLQARSLSHV